MKVNHAPVAIFYAANASFSDIPENVFSQKGVNFQECSQNFCQ